IEETVIEVAEQVMAGDLLRALVDEIRNLKDPWAKTPEKRQAETIDRLTRQVETAVKSAVGIMAANGRQVAKGEIESVTFKDGIKVVLQVPKFDAHRHDIADAQGRTVMLVIADHEQFMGGVADVRPDPDQGHLIPDNAALQ
ncbi:MAG: DNA translocase FtsK, partial [Patescibacteria group bacterium]|nr:DNA translocase FtsK [Patescibacteria group bacterium]